VLFDENKKPYHLMLQRFDQLGGLRALFDAFHWSLSLLTDTSSEASANNNGMDRDKLQEGTLEFIEAWLQLVQKLVNTRHMLETRHSLNQNSAAAASSGLGHIKNDAAAVAEIKRVCAFDPVRFLFKVHKEAFEALMCLWSDDSKSFIIRENYALSETVLNILCQILVGDSQLQSKLAEQKTAASLPSTTTAAGASTSNGGQASFVRAYLFNDTRRAAAGAGGGDENAGGVGHWRSSVAGGQQPHPPPPPPPPPPPQQPPERQLTPLDHEIIMQMIAMGFSAELAQEAVVRSPPDSLEQAVEYCFNHPQGATTAVEATPAVQQQETAAVTTTVSTDSMSSAVSNEPATPVIEQAGENQNSNVSEMVTENSAPAAASTTVTTAMTVTPSNHILPPPPLPTSSKIEEPTYQLDKVSFFLNFFFL
jgi:hypothetical protein